MNLILVYEKFENLSPFLTFVQYQEELSEEEEWLEIPYALITLEKNTINRKEIELTKIESKVLLKDTVYNFAETNKEQLEKIYQESFKLGYDLSWLQIMQVFVIQESNNNSLLTVLNNLDVFYKNNGL